MNKININNKVQGIPDENVLDLREIYQARQKVQEKPIEEKVVKKEAKKKKPKKKREKKFKKWLEARKLKKKNKLNKEPESPDEGITVDDGVGWFKGLVKPLAGFALVCVVLVLPFTSSAFYNQALNLKDKVLNITNEAVGEFKQGGMETLSSDYDEAQVSFESAVGSFQTAQGELKILNQAVTNLAKLIPGGEQIEAAENLLIAGENLSGAAADLNRVLATFNGFEVGQLTEEDSEIGLTTGIMVAHSALRPVVSKITLANEALAKVPESAIPEDGKEQILLAKEVLPSLEKDLKKALGLSETFLAILGHQEQKRYLVLFQNNREMRATGGFLGSLAEVEIHKGKVESIDIPGGGVYDVSGQMTEKVASPEPLRLVNPYWYLQDANWWPDFPTSAEKIEWFYYRSQGKAIDGIITLTPDVIIDLLGVTGPIDLSEDYGVIIDKDNFYEVVQTEAEKKYDETQESKKIIGDLTPLLLQKMFDLEGVQLWEAAGIFYSGLQEKDILFYFSDEDLQADIVDRGWGGEIKEAKHDYLSVINTNIAGGKSDAAIEEIIEHEINILDDGTVKDKVKITRTHKAEEGDIFAEINNWNYLRVYVPEGSKLVRATGFDYPDEELWLEADETAIEDEDLKNISGEVIETNYKNVFENNEFSKTVFAGWVETLIGDSSQIELEYELPFKIQTDNFLTKTDSYSLMVQKQPGSFDSLYNAKLNLPDSLESLWNSNSEIYTGVSQPLRTDSFWGVLLTEK